MMTVTIGPPSFESVEPGCKRTNNNYSIITNKKQVDALSNDDYSQLAYYLAMPKLIIIRGPSGSGKSSVAIQLRNHIATSSNVALIEQDYYKEVMFAPKSDEVKQVVRERMHADVRFALDKGFHVILEGILSVKSHGKAIEDLLKYHPEENYLFFYNTTFEETLRRHAFRAKAVDFGEAEMREWFTHAEALGYDFEYEIDEQLTLLEAVDMILEESGLK